MYEKVSILKEVNVTASNSSSPLKGVLGVTEVMNTYKRVQLIVTGIRYEGKFYPMGETILSTILREKDTSSELSTFKSFVKKGDKFVVCDGVVGDRKIGVSFKLLQSGERYMFTMSDDRHPNECPKSSVYVELKEGTIDLPL